MRVNIDTGNVKLRYTEGSMISINCTENETKVAVSINTCSKVRGLRPVMTINRNDLLYLPPEKKAM